MAQKPDGKAAKTERVTFTRPAAERIAKVVRKVEQGDRGAEPLRFDRTGGGGSVRIRFCSWTSTWTYGSSTLVTFSESTAATATASNTILAVGPGDGWVAKKGTVGWSLVALDLTKQPHFSGNVVQLFGHDASGVAKWYDTTNCSTAT